MNNKKKIQGSSHQWKSYRLMFSTALVSINKCFCLFFSFFLSICLLFFVKFALAYLFTCSLKE